MRAHRYRLPLAVAAGVAAVGVATLLLRPRSGLIEPAAVDPTAYFSAEQLERAREYRGPQRALALGSLALSGIALAVMALRPPRSLRRLIDRVDGRPLLGGGVVGAVLVITVTVITLPLAVVRHERAVEVGLSTQGLGAWLLDVTKATGISAAMAAGGGLVVVALIRRFPRHWWAPGGLVGILASVVLVYASPVVLDPLFNDFEPLPEGELRSDVLELADRAGVSVGEVYRVDASRRTIAANAYVGGLGETKRVVLYDNLIEGFPADQTRAVVAHELGHVAHDDLRDGLLWVAIVALPSMLVVQRLAEAIVRRRGPRPRAARRGAGRLPGAPAEAGVALPGVRAGTGIALPGVPAAVPAVALALAVVAFAVQIPANWLSRQVEAHADAFALRITEDPAAFVGLQRSLDVRNVSEPDPPEALQKVLGTHPTTLERIGFALASAGER